jgi:uncharacterized membrane protein YczE
VPPDRRLRRSVQLLTGLVLYGATAAMMVLAGLGLDPWDVLHQGLSRTVGLGIGTWAIRAVRTIIEATVLATGFLLGGTVGIGTVLYAIAIGPISHITIPALAISAGRRALPRRSSTSAPRPARARAGSAGP